MESSFEKQMKSNKEQRRWFIQYWADYMKKVPNSVWSKQQNMLINSQLKTASQDKELYLYVKKAGKNWKKTVIK